MQKISIPVRFSEQQGRILILLARRAILQKFGIELKKSQLTAMKDGLIDDSFQSNRGTFVTLTIENNLRGCIGNLTAKESILKSIEENAGHAAFHDHRFSPLKKNELDQIRIEISILTEPEPLSYNDASDLIAILKEKKCGVIIKKGSASATFLPQVWEQIPDPEEFLSHLCLKAGLTASAWQSENLDIMIYEVQCFMESS